MGGLGSLEPGFGTEVLDDPRGSFSGVLDPEFHDPGWTQFRVLTHWMSKFGTVNELYGQPSYFVDPSGGAVSQRLDEDENKFPVEFSPLTGYLSSDAHGWSPPRLDSCVIRCVGPC